MCSSIGGYAQTIINNLSDEGIVSLNNASINLYVDWDGVSNTTSANVLLHLNYESLVDKPCLEWTASSYNEWKSQWPDITINGLFPTMNNATFFGNLLEIDETQDYNQNNIVDWWEDKSNDCSD